MCVSSKQLSVLVVGYILYVVLDQTISLLSMLVDTGHGQSIRWVECSFVSCLFFYFICNLVLFIQHFFKWILINQPTTHALIEDMLGLKTGCYEDEGFLDEPCERFNIVDNDGVKIG